jgi:hypothetical protein
LIATKLGGRRARARLSDANLISRAVGIGAAGGVGNALGAAWFPPVGALAFVGLAGFSRLAVTARQRTPTAVGNTSALRVESITGFFQAATVVGDPTAAAGFRRNTRATIERAATSIGYDPTTGANFLACFGDTRGRSADIGFFSAAMLARGACAAIDHHAAPIVDHSALGVQFHAGFGATPALIVFSAAAANERSNTLTARQHIIATVGYEPALRPRGHAGFGYARVRAAPIRAIATTIQAARALSARHHATTAIRCLSTFRSQSQAGCRFARRRIRPSLVQRPRRQRGRFSLLGRTTPCKPRPQKREPLRISPEHGKHYAQGSELRNARPCKAQKPGSPSVDKTSRPVEDNQ